ncbi:MAG: hypothetical protein Q8P84_00595, partial [Deltaproteobacteria bacterium]|nr:hypothetical protein [Deltaproteobacteria bacterium]
TAVYSGRHCENGSICYNATIQREVTAPTEADLERAAKALAKTIGGYHNVQFKKFEEPKTAPVSAAPVVKGEPDKCAGEWKNRPICKK